MIIVVVSSDLVCGFMRIVDFETVSRSDYFFLLIINIIEAKQLFDNIPIHFRFIRPQPNPIYY